MTDNNGITATLRASTTMARKAKAAWDPWKHFTSPLTYHLCTQVEFLNRFRLLLRPSPPAFQCFKYEILTTKAGNGWPGDEATLV